MLENTFRQYYLSTKTAKVCAHPRGEQTFARMPRPPAPLAATLVVCMRACVPPCVLAHSTPSTYNTHLYAPHTQVMLDPATQKSRGYGFVRFGIEAERDRALTEMNGECWGWGGRGCCGGLVFRRTWMEVA